MDFLACSGNYIFAQEQIASISTSGFTELLTLLNDGTVTQNDIDSIKTEYLKGELEVVQSLEKAMEKTDGK